MNTLKNKLKIMVLSARYPPLHAGGYELRCKDIMDELHKRGHQIFVLTSEQENTSHHASEESNPYPVYRCLSSRIRVGSAIDKLTRNPLMHYFGLFLTFVRELALDFRDLSRIERKIQDFQPDILYLGHITIFSRSLMPFLAEAGVPLVYDEGGAGLIDCWRERGIWYKFVEMDLRHYPIGTFLKMFFGRIIGCLSNNRLKRQWAWPDNLLIFFNSNLNLQNAIAHGVPTNNAQVINSGLDLNMFSFKPRRALGAPLKILVPGRIEPRKGQADAVQLLAAFERQGIDGKLVIVGEIWVDSFHRKLLGEISKGHMEDRVMILPMVEHKELVDLYQQTDICFFPSYYRTGFSRIPLEAMACGCIVFSYGNEGSDEVIQNGHNGFLIAPQAFKMITDKVVELSSHPEMLQQILMYARSHLEANFSMRMYIDKIEKLILSSDEIC